VRKDISTIKKFKKWFWIDGDEIYCSGGLDCTECPFFSAFKGCEHGAAKKHYEKLQKKETIKEILK